MVDRRGRFNANATGVKSRSIRSARGSYHNVRIGHSASWLSVRSGSALRDIPTLGCAGAAGPNDRESRLEAVAQARFGQQVSRSGRVGFEFAA
jgi:hypothetical protein